jgi:hypothetical protein
VHRTATFQLDNISAWTSNLDGGASYLFLAVRGLFQSANIQDKKKTYFVKHLVICMVIQAVSGLK